VPTANGKLGARDAGCSLLPSEVQSSNALLELAPVSWRIYSELLTGNIGFASWQLLKS
jgi:hypothetical protein